MGEELENFEILTNNEEGVFTIKPPKNHENFEIYRITYTEETGVCQVLAFGYNQENDRYGYKVRGEFIDTSDYLSSLYGDGLSIGFSTGGEYSNNLSHWTLSVEHGETVFSHFWTHENSKNLPADVKRIVLSVGAENSESPYLIMAYEFQNFEICEKKIEIEKM